MFRTCFCALFFLCLSEMWILGDVVINEISYHPSEDVPIDLIRPQVKDYCKLPNGDLLDRPKNNSREPFKNPEFIELYNPTNSKIDLSGYRFTQGIDYTFSPGSTIASNAFIIVVKDVSMWKEERYSNLIFGPFEGGLSNSGETLVFSAPDGRVVDRVQYKDEFPWPRGADGYGPSLERISASLPSDDPHNWRASLRFDGSPLKNNTVAHMPDKPLLLSSALTPESPQSTESVVVEAAFDSTEIVESCVLVVEAEMVDATVVREEFPMEILERNTDRVAFRSSIPPFPSQTLVRCWFNVMRVDGRTVSLPHVGDPCPFVSYFVYDGEIPSRFPILWLYPPNDSILADRNIFQCASGVVIKPVTAESPLVFDGASVLKARGGRKVKFVKGNDFAGISNLKITDTYSNSLNYLAELYVFVEDFSYRIFKKFPILSPDCEWYRVIEAGEHSPRTVIQRPNERFFEIRGRDRNGNIYKLVDNVFVKKSNIYEPDDDIQKLIRSLQDENLRAETIERWIDKESFLNYDMVTVFTSNWDGFHKNQMLYHNPPPVDRWEVIPWDLDNSFWPYNVEYSVDAPLNGMRETIMTGIVTQPLHQNTDFHQTYLERFRKELDDRFAEGRLVQMADELEALLLEDVDLMESYTGIEDDFRRKTIQDVYNGIRKFIHERHTYMRGELQTNILNDILY